MIEMNQDEICLHWQKYFIGQNSNGSEGRHARWVLVKPHGITQQHSWSWSHQDQLLQAQRAEGCQ